MPLAFDSSSFSLFSQWHGASETSVAARMKETVPSLEASVSIRPKLSDLGSVGREQVGAWRFFAGDKSILFHLLVFYKIKTCDVQCIVSSLQSFEARATATTVAAAAQRQRFAAAAQAELPVLPAAHAEGAHDEQFGRGRHQGRGSHPGSSRRQQRHALCVSFTTSAHLSF